MARRRVANPLAFAVLGSLSERPMHPYEISTMLRARGKDQSIKVNYGSLYSIVASLEKPRRILMMVKAGEPTDATIAALRPLLEPGDILIDGGNTHFPFSDLNNVQIADLMSEFLKTKNLD